MAKSRRKYPIVKQEKFNKHMGNRKLRNMCIDFPLKGGQYKRITKNFALWKYRWTWEDAVENWKNNTYDVRDRHANFEEYRDYWERTTIRK